jgi:hypothetical protein
MEGEQKRVDDEQQLIGDTLAGKWKERFKKLEAAKKAALELFDNGKAVEAIQLLAREFHDRKIYKTPAIYAMLKTHEKNPELIDRAFICNFV